MIKVVKKTGAGKDSLLLKRIQDLVRESLIEALDQFTVNESARYLGIDRSTLFRWVLELGIKHPRIPRSGCDAAGGVGGNEAWKTLKHESRP